MHSSSRNRGWGGSRGRQSASPRRSGLFAGGVDHLACGAKAIDGSRHTRIDAYLQQHLADFFRAYTIAKRSRYMELELMRPVEHTEHCNVQHAADLARQFLAAPDRAPAIFVEHFLERSSTYPAAIEHMNANATFAAHTLDLFEHSPHFAEEIVRNPELVEEIARAADATATTATPPTSGELRRWYRREMLRVQAASICLSQPIFDTLARTSDLADASATGFSFEAMKIISVKVVFSRADSVVIMSSIIRGKLFGGRQRAFW